MSVAVLVSVGPAAQVPGSEVAAESGQCVLNPHMIKVSWISIG